MSELEPVQQNMLIPITSLYEHKRNFRSHPPEQIKKLKASLERWGQVRSIVAQFNADSTYTIVAGHGLVQAAQELVNANAAHYKRFGKMRVDVIPASWSSEQVTGYLVADNTLSNDASDDEELLATLLSEQQNAGFDLASLGTDDETLRQMLDALGDEYAGGGQEDGDGGDEFDTTPQEGPTRTHVGELWALGEHRLLVGDCTKGGNIQKLMQGEKADLIFTDPPYNVNVAGGTHDPRDKKNFGKGPRIQNDSMNDNDFKAFLLKVFKNIISVTRPGASIYVCHADTEGIAFRTAFVEAGWNLAQCLIWAKQQFVFGRSDYHWQHEPILYGWCPGAGHDFYGERNQSTLWNIDRPMRSEMEHPTQKPLDLVQKALVNSSNCGDLILDCFLGGGSTLIACQRTNRRCFGLELDPRYADVILRRYEAESGQQATLLERIEEASHA